MPKLEDVQDCQTIGDLQALKIGRLEYDVGSRGGTLGFAAVNVAEYVGCDPSALPRKYGCFCNYLGGGVRGSVMMSRHDPSLTGPIADLLDALAQACQRAYLNAENGLNDEHDENDEPNWDAKATKAARNAGMTSAY